MDRMDTTLREFFGDAVVSGGRARRLVPRLAGGPATLEKLAGRFRIEATDRGVARLYPGRGVLAASARARRHAAQAVEELDEYLAGRRAFFSVDVDLAGVAPFQARVLAEAGRIPFGETESYAELARRIGRPRAARAVGNALGANPVPVIVPCHRVIRGDGSWGHYAFGGEMKTRLLALDEDAPARPRARDARARRLRVDAHRLPARLPARAARRRGEPRRLRLRSRCAERGVPAVPCLPAGRRSLTSARSGR